MPGIFTVNNNHTVILSSDAVKLCTELSKLTEEQVLYIILAYDYLESPWRRYPLEDRKRLAKRKIWGENEFIPEDFKNVSSAIDEYKGLIYDIDYEMRDSLLSKMKTLDNNLTIETDTTKINLILKSQDIIKARLDELDVKIDIKQEVIKLKSSKKLSYIETFMRNRKQYIIKMNEVMRAKKEANA